MRRTTRRFNQCVHQETSSDSSENMSDSEFKVSDVSESEKQKNRSIWSLKGLSSQIKVLVKELQTTTYKQLASILIDRLQNELSTLSNIERKKEIQNLKRRVYDAINVLVAMKVLTKTKKSIGFGTIDKTTMEKNKLQLQQRKNKINELRQQFIKSTQRYILIRKLIERNQLFKVENQQESYQLPIIAVSAVLPDDPNTFELIMTKKSQTRLLIQSKKSISVMLEHDIIKRVLEQ